MEALNLGERTCEERLDLVLLVKNKYADLVCRSSSIHLTKEDKQKKWKEIFNICAERKHKWTLGKNALYLQKTKWPGIKRDALARRFGYLTEVDAIVLNLLNGSLSEEKPSTSEDKMVNQISSDLIDLNRLDDYSTPQSCLEFLVAKVSPSPFLSRSNSPVIPETASNNIGDNDNNNDQIKNTLSSVLPLTLQSNHSPAPPIFSSLIRSSKQNFNSKTNHKKLTLQQKPASTNEFLTANGLPKSLINGVKTKRKYAENDEEQQFNHILNFGNEGGIEHHEDNNIDFLLKQTKLKYLESQIALNESQIEVNRSITSLNTAKLKFFCKSLQDNTVNTSTCCNDGVNNHNLINELL